LSGAGRASMVGILGLAMFDAVISFSLFAAAAE
jgi:hypothetical protein